jgi:hypothetical protein
MLAFAVLPCAHEMTITLCCRANISALAAARRPSRQHDRIETMNRSSFSDTATGRPLRPLLAAVLAAFTLAACSNTANVASGADAEGLLKASAAAARP